MGGTGFIIGYGGYLRGLFRYIYEHMNPYQQNPEPSQERLSRTLSKGKNPYNELYLLLSHDTLIYPPLRFLESLYMDL